MFNTTLNNISVISYLPNPLQAGLPLRPSPKYPNVLCLLPNIPPDSMSTLSHSVISYKLKFWYNPALDAIYISIYRMLLSFLFLCLLKRLSGVAVFMLVSGVLYFLFDSWAGQTKDYKLGICCFSTENAALRNKKNDYLVHIWQFFKLLEKYVINIQLMTFNEVDTRIY